MIPLMILIYLVTLYYLMERLENIFAQNKLILETLDRIGKLPLPVEPASSIEFYTIINGQKVRFEKMELAVSDKAAIALRIVDKFGNPAKVDGAPVWGSVDSAMGQLVVAADGMSAEFLPAGPMGQVVVEVVADPEIGSAVGELRGSAVLDLVAGKASAMEVVPVVVNVEPVA